MILLSPAGLFGLLALPVILWLHLRRQRPKRAAVPSLTPWLALAGAAPPRRHRIPPSVLLAMHLAVATLLAFALANPIWSMGPPSVVDRAVILDVTTSMAAAQRWPEAVNRAKALLAATRGEATLVTLGPRPRVLVARDSEGTGALAALDKLVPGGSGALTDEALTLAAAAAGPGAERVVVTDGAIPPPSEAQTAVRWEVVGSRVAEGSDAKSPTGPPNVAVVNAAARTTGGETRLFARLASFGWTGSLPLELVVDGKPFDSRSVALSADGTLETVWTLPPNARTAQVRVSPADALAADDVADVPLEPRPLRVQLVGESEALARALGGLPDVRLTRAGLGTFRADGSVDVTVFAGRAPEVLPPGGVLVFGGGGGVKLGGESTTTDKEATLNYIAPSTGIATATGDSASANATATHAMSTTTAFDLVGDHPLVTGLDLTGVLLGGAEALEVPIWAAPVLQVGERILAYAGTPPRVKVPGGPDTGPSRVAVFGWDPDAGTLVRRVAFPLLMARTVAWLVPPAPPATLPAGQPVALPLAAYSVRRPDGEREGTRDFFEHTALPGLYEARDVETGTGRTYRFAVHAGDLRESDLRWQTSFPEAVGEAESRAGAERGGRPVWPWLVAAALLLMGVEGAWRGWGGRVR